MKSQQTAALVLVALALTACQQPGQGTGGLGVQSGTAREEGSTPYAIGRTSPSQRSGLANENMAVGRAEAAMDVSGSGSGELSRRAAAATVAPREEPDDTPVTELLFPEQNESREDQALLDRVRRALTSGRTQEESIDQALSIQTLNNLRLGVNQRTVTLGGRVSNVEERGRIEAVVRGVNGVNDVVNNLQVNP